MNFFQFLKAHNCGYAFKTLFGFDKEKEDVNLEKQ